LDLLSHYVSIRRSQHTKEQHVTLLAIMVHGGIHGTYSGLAFRRFWDGISRDERELICMGWRICFVFEFRYLLLDRRCSVLACPKNPLL